LDADMTIDRADAGGLGLAALALATASLAHDVRRGRISSAERRDIYTDARALVHDRAGFIVDPGIAQAADDFLSVSEVRNPRAPAFASAACIMMRPSLPSC
jgi:hypothetical protein